MIRLPLSMLPAVAQVHAGEDPTCSEALAARGYSLRRYSSSETTGRREIVAVRTGRVVARLTAHEAWDWMERWDRKVRRAGT